jgi:F0F1-type ATP synthase membrane subunit b/b'
MTKLLLATLMALTLAACSDRDDGVRVEGNVDVDTEEMKDSAERNLKKAERQLEKAGREIEAGAEKAADKLEDAGDKLKDKFNDTKDRLDSDKDAKIEVEVKRD